MRRYLALVTVLVGGAVTLGVSPAVADDGAVRYVSCPTTSFISIAGGFTFSYCFSDVVTPSGNANAHFEGDLLDLSTAPSSATIIEGFGCFAAYPSGGFTTDTRLVITPSGHVNGTCKFH